MAGSNAGRACPSGEGSSAPEDAEGGGAAGPQAGVLRRLARRTALAVGCLALLLGGTAAALLAGELLVRWAAPQQLVLIRPDLWRPADTVGWTHRAGVDTRVNTGERTVRFVTDERGFRVAPSGRPDGDLDVLLLGDSFMAALQVEHSRSFAGIVERELSQLLDRPVAVHNAAVGGWDALHYLLRGRQLLERGDYDLTIVSVYLGNDLVHARTDAFDPRHPEERSGLRLPSEATADELVDALARPANDWLEVRSHLFVLSKNALRSVLMRLGLTARYIPEELRRDRADDPAWDLTARILAELDDVSRSRGVPALFALAPSDYQVDPELLRRHARALGVDPSLLDAEQPNHLLGSRLRERGLRTVDLLPALRAADEGAELYGEVDPHFSPAGHRAMWRALREPLVELLQSRPLPAGDGELPGRSAASGLPTEEDPAQVEASSFPEAPEAHGESDATERVDRDDRLPADRGLGDDVDRP